MTQDELITKLCYGTTTRPADLKVLFFGSHVALIRYKGGSYYSGRMLAYAPSHVNLFRFAKDFCGGFHHASGEELHEGRYNKIRLNEMIEIAKTADLVEPVRILAKQQAEQKEHAEHNATLLKIQSDMNNMKAYVETNLKGNIFASHGPYWSNDGAYGTLEVQLPNRMIIELNYSKAGVVVSKATFPPETTTNILDVLAKV